MAQFFLGVALRKKYASQDAQCHDILPLFLMPLDIDPPHCPILLRLHPRAHTSTASVHPKACGVCELGRGGEKKGNDG